MDRQTLSLLILFGGCQQARKLAIFFRNYKANTIKSHSKNKKERFLCKYKKDEAETDLILAAWTKTF